MTAPAEAGEGIASMELRDQVGARVKAEMECRKAIRVLFAFAAVAFALLVPARARSVAQNSSESSVDFKQAEALLAQNRLDEARTLTINGLEQDGSSVTGYNLLGMILARQQDYTNATAAFEKALAIDPNSVKTHNNLGDLYVSVKKFDLAEKEFRTVVRLAPQDRNGNYNLGVVLIAEGSPAAAIPYLERVRPADLPTKFNLIRALLESRRTAEGLKLENEVSAQEKDSVETHYSLGVLMASEKQYKMAQLELERASELRPGTFEILFNLGQVLLLEGKSPEAELSLNQALNLQPDSVETLYLLAQAESNQSRPLDALDHLMRAHKLAPQNVDIIFLMAQVSMSQNFFEDAIPLLESGLAIDPKRPALIAALGESYFMSGRTEKAIEEFDQLVAIDRSARSYAFLGLSYRNLGRFDEAKEKFQLGLQLDSKNALCLYNLGYIAERQGNTADAEGYFEKALSANPNFGDALLEMANLRMAAKRYAEAEVYLRRFVRVGSDPATGYYKLALAERSLHETEAAERDLKTFQTLSKNTSSGPYPFQHLFDFLDNRAQLAAPARAQLDLADLTEEIKKHPGQPEDLFMLAEDYLKAGRVEDARATIAQLDQLSSSDGRTLAGAGVLLARYRLYDDAIEQFKEALEAEPDSDDVKYDLADADFRKGNYADALATAETVSAEGRKDDAYLALLGDIYAHLGNAARASEIYRDAIERDPDNDQDYLSLALLEMRENDVAGARQVLLKGQTRIPDSGKIIWGLGLVAVLEGNMTEAAKQFERTVDLLPEWSGGYSTLGVFYFETGQLTKAREVLARFKESSVSGDLGVSRIEQVLDQASSTAAANETPVAIANKAQFLQLALALVDKTL
jgi:tetratricopeptide (TPR) repeat protein